MENPLRQDLWRAGHAHAGVLLLLSLIVLRYVDNALIYLAYAGAVVLVTGLLILGVGLIKGGSAH